MTCSRDSGATMGLHRQWSTFWLQSSSMLAAREQSESGYQHGCSQSQAWAAQFHLSADTHE